MMNLTEYCEKLTGNVLFIHCNDCVAINRHIRNPYFNMITSLTNLNDDAFHIEKDQIGFFIENKNINRIILVTHYNCELISHLLNGEMKVNDKGFKHLFYNSTKLRFKDYFNKKKEEQLKVLLTQLAFHVRKIDHILKENFLECEIKLDGILIDESNSDEVIGLDSLLSEIIKNPLSEN